MHCQFVWLILKVIFGGISCLGSTRYPFGMDLVCRPLVVGRVGDILPFTSQFLVVSLGVGTAFWRQVGWVENVLAKRCRDDV